jgi:hypothetical protein
MMTPSRSAGGKARHDRHAVWRAVKVRYRDAGHVRFDLPRELRNERVAAFIEERMREVEGVYRVAVFVGLGKLSIRWDETVCDLNAIVRHLATAVTHAADLPTAVPAPTTSFAGGEPRPSVFGRLLEQPPFAALRERYGDLRAKADLVYRHFARKFGRQTPLPFDAKDWAVHFINDLVAFYLIRVHWIRITTQWLPRPWAYRYQWLTVVYLTFLLVRHRKATAPKAKK